MGSCEKVERLVIIEGTEVYLWKRWDSSLWWYSCYSWLDGVVGVWENSLLIISIFLRQLCLTLRPCHKSCQLECCQHHKKIPHSSSSPENLGPPRGPFGLHVDPSGQHPCLVQPSHHKGDPEHMYSREQRRHIRRTSSYSLVFAALVFSAIITKQITCRKPQLWS